MGMRFNPPPQWPAPPDGFIPPPGWQPDPAWPPAPPGWQLWVDDGQPAFPAQPIFPAYGGGTFGGGQPASGRGVSGWAVAALVCGLLGFTVLGLILGVVFGLVALGRIRDYRQRGKGLAIAAIALSAAWLVLGVLGILYGGAFSAHVTVGQVNSGPVKAGATGTVSGYSLVTGDCFDYPAGASSVTTVTVLPCSRPHDTQIFATFRLQGNSNFDYPGATAIGRLATAGCNARIDASLDKPLLSNRMQIRFLYPLQSGWLTGRRNVSCMIVSPSANLATSLLLPGVAKN